jgi:hypothetical protein
MADYYCDGTITSASGQGDGSIGNPWGKTDDLWDYCLQQIQAAGGASATGDNLIVLDGGFNNTYNPNAAIISPAYGQANMLYVRPYVLDGTQRIPWDLGGYAVFGTSTNRRGYQFYFCNFTNLSRTHWSVRANAYCSVFYCSFDGSGQEHTGVVLLGSQSRLIGCRFFNDRRIAGLFHQGTGSQQVMWNIFEPAFNGYMAYTYASVFAHNLILPTASMTYNTGMVLPIQTCQIFRNTFYSPYGYGSGIYVTNSYESNYIANNYFEGIYRSVYGSGASQHTNAYEVLAGNRAYNMTDPTTMPPIPSAVLINENNDWDMAESGLVDPANGDYRPNKNLIHQGWRDDELNTEITSLSAELGIKPTIGAYDAVTIAKKIRDLY